LLFLKHKSKAQHAAAVCAKHKHGSSQPVLLPLLKLMGKTPTHFSHISTCHKEQLYALGYISYKSVLPFKWLNAEVVCLLTNPLTCTPKTSKYDN
jgi:hypothetical protein